MVTIPNSTDQVQIESTAPNPEELEAVLKEVNAFLLQFDSGIDLPGWQKSSDHLVSVIGKEDWKLEVDIARSRFGARLMTEFARAIRVDELPQGITGYFLAVVLISTFEKVKVAETITYSLEDGSWKLLGYSYQRVPS